MADAVKAEKKSTKAKPDAEKAEKKVNPKKATAITIIVFILIVAVSFALEYFILRPDIYRKADFPKDKTIREIDFSYGGSNYKLTKAEDIKSFTNILKEVGLNDVEDTSKVPTSGETYTFVVKSTQGTLTLRFIGDYVIIGGTPFKARSNVITRLYDVYVNAYKTV